MEEGFGDLSPAVGWQAQGSHQQALARGPEQSENRPGLQPYAKG